LRLHVETELAERHMSIAKQILVLMVLSALAYGGYAGYGHWKAGIAATSPEAGKPGAKPGGQGAGRGGRATSVEIANAEKRALSRVIEAVGTTRALRSVDIKPQADGTIMEIRFQPGSTVRKDDVLFVLDDDIQKADLIQAEAEMEKSQLALTRAAKLNRSNIATRATVEDLEAAMATAGAAVSRAKRRLADRVIRAPFDGTPSLKGYDVGAQVEPANVLTTLDDLSTVQVEFGVPEQFFAIARQGLAVIATSAAWPGREFRAIVSEIDTRIDPVSRVFRVRADIANRDGALVSGMFMQVSMTLQSDAYVMVPEEAILVEGPKTFLFVVADDKAQKREVRTGVREPGFVSIVSGLAEGEAIITAGTSKVRNGADVKVVTAEAEKTEQAQ
jgi:membrane fusion protein (multidrug efflux system)